MRCPKCRATNPPGRRFCNNCGHDLQQAAVKRGSPRRGSAVFWLVVAIIVVGVITAVAVLMLVLGNGEEKPRVIIVTEEVTRVITNTPPEPAETPSPAPASELPDTTMSPLTGLSPAPKILAVGMLVGDQP
jgi:predicted nucleic acid-binding Zn ribbon protein